MTLDLIGPLYEPVAGRGDPVVALWGYHVNATPDVLEARPELETARVHPVVMRRVWAGDDAASPSMTVALRFADEAAAVEALGDLWPVDET